MPLTQVGLSAMVQWAQQKTNTGASVTRQGPDSNNFTLNNIVVATFNQLFTATYTILTTANQDIDLTSLTNLVSESFTYGHCLAIFVTATGSTITLGPGASNAFNYFWSGTSPAIKIDNGGMVMLSGPVAGPGGVVDATHKMIRLSNTGGTTATVEITILGSTT